MLTGIAAGEAGELNSTFKSARKERILIADDEMVQRTFGRIMSIYLPNIILETALSAEMTAEKFQEGHHAVLLLDSMIPVMNGVNTRLKK